MKMMPSYYREYKKPVVFIKKTLTKNLRIYGCIFCFQNLNSIISQWFVNFERIAWAIFFYAVMIACFNSSRVKYCVFPLYTSLVIILQIFFYGTDKAGQFNRDKLVSLVCKNYTCKMTTCFVLLKGYLFPFSFELLVALRSNCVLTALGTWVLPKFH